MSRTKIRPLSQVGALAGVLLVTSLSADMAQAQIMPGGGQQMLCGNRAEIVSQLGQKYGETRRSMGLTGRRGVVELFASAETGSWTILLTSPQGVTCLMAAGEAFEADPVTAAGNPA